MVYETIAGRSDVNLDDLSGTELEAAETSLFREAVAESIRATMWLGDTERNGQLATFDGFVKRLLADSGPGENDVPCFYLPENFAGNSETDAAEKVFKAVGRCAGSSESVQTARQSGLSGNVGYLCQIRGRTR